MVIRQLSVFVENKPGKLLQVLEVLAENSIDVSALSLADTSEFGVLRLIVDQPDFARSVLSEAGVAVRISHVAAVAMNDVPGGAGSIIRLLSAAGLNIEYMYACVGKISGKALMVLRTDNTELTEEILTKNNFNNVRPDDIYRITG